MLQFSPWGIYIIAIYVYTTGGLIYIDSINIPYSLYKQSTQLLANGVMRKIFLAGQKADTKHMRCNEGMKKGEKSTMKAHEVAS